MDIVLVRHGSTLYNERRIYGGINDIALSDKGICEIECFSNYIKEIHFDEIYTSPLKRAVQSADILKLNYKISSLISEMNFGIFEGYTYEEINERYPTEVRSWEKDIFNYRIPGGEGLKDVYLRTEEFIKSLGCGDKRILVITHGGIIGCALSLALGNEKNYFKFSIRHGMASIISKDEDYMFIKGINVANGLIEVLT